MEGGEKGGRGGTGGRGGEREGRKKGKKKEGGRKVLEVIDVYGIDWGDGDKMYTYPQPINVWSSLEYDFLWHIFSRQLESKSR